MFLVNFKNFLKNLQNSPLLLSFLLHGILFFFLIIKFTSIKNEEFPNQVRVVELVLPITNKTNLPPAKSKKIPEQTKQKPVENEKPKTEAVKPEPAKDEKPKTEAAKPEPVKNEKPKTEAVKPEPVKNEKPKTEDVKPEPAKNEKPKTEAVKPESVKNEQPKNDDSKQKTKKPDKNNTKKEQKNDSIDELLTSLEGKEREHIDLESELESLNSSNTFDDTKMLSISEIDAIKSQIQKCWTEPAGGLRKNGLSVLLRIKLLIDGNVEDIKIKVAPNSDSIIMNQLAVDTAIRAIKMCAPYTMPMNSYNSWKELEIMFDPKEMQ